MVLSVITGTVITGVHAVMGVLGVRRRDAEVHPFLGWLLSWSQDIWLIFFRIGFNAWFALVSAAPTTFMAIGPVTGSPGSQLPVSAGINRKALSGVKGRTTRKCR